MDWKKERKKRAVRGHEPEFVLHRMPFGSKGCLGQADSWGQLAMHDASHGEREEGGRGQSIVTLLNFENDYISKDRVDWKAWFWSIWL